MSFVTNVESAAEKVGGFLVKEVTAAENLLGAKTGNAKLNLVVTAVTAGLTAYGIPVTQAESEIKTLVDGIVALFNKTGVFTKSA